MDGMTQVNQTAILDWAKEDLKMFVGVVGVFWFLGILTGMGYLIFFPQHASETYFLLNYPNLGYAGSLRYMGVEFSTPFAKVGFLVASIKLIINIVRDERRVIVSAY